MQDVMAALITHLNTVTALTDLVSTRIFGGAIPESEIKDMPQKLLLLRYSGGPEVFRTHRVQRQRIDFFSYGEDYYEAGRVDRNLADALIALSRNEALNTILHSAGYGGVVQLKEPDTGWEYVFRSALIIVGETAA